MPRDLPQPGSPRDWLRHAEADIALARVELPEGSFYEYLCFHAQQAAEKSLKAVLTHIGVEFPKTHDLERLVDLLPPPAPPSAVLAAAVSLTDYAVLTRYPRSLHEPVDGDECRAAVLAAEAVLAWAEGEIGLDTDSAPGCGT